MPISILLILSAFLCFTEPGLSEKAQGRSSEDAKTSAGADMHPSPAGILWNEPTDIALRDLRFGPGGAEGAPKEPFVFLKEDLEGTSPKFDVRDSAGTTWKVKIGVEARPEVAASRLVWAAGYFTPDNYFVPELRIENMPVLRRGQELIGADGVVRGARFKRSTGVRRIETWKWRKNPFTGTRELNGLRVLMALINNVDLKDVNNAILRDSRSASDENHYMVSDLGSSFSGAIWPLELKGNLQSYRQSKFITDASDDTVDFYIPTGPAPLDFPHMMWRLYRTKLRWIGKGIPRADARALGKTLSQLSMSQILDAFEYSGYTSDEARGFTDVLLERIAALQNL